MINQLTRVLQAAIGYLELGMPAEGLRELDTLPPEGRAQVECIELRAVLEQHLGNWQGAADAYAELGRREPDNAERFIAQGCCLYELRRIPEARDALLAAGPSARHQGLWNYHLACYEAILGHRARARELLQTSLKLDPGLRAMALQNENLTPLLKPLPDPPAP
ncbi:MAG: hypothetical protein ACKOET_06560 [Verrucomicrobiota bacterium]